MSEPIVSKYSFPVDGFCESTNEIFKFQGCVFYGCEKCNTNRDLTGNLKELNCFENNVKELQKPTQEKMGKLQEKGFTVHQSVSVNGKDVKRATCVTFVKTIKSVQPKKQLNFVKVLQEIQNGQMYAFLFINIYTPEH